MKQEKTIIRLFRDLTLSVGDLPRVEVRLSRIDAQFLAHALREYTGLEARSVYGDDVRYIPAAVVPPKPQRHVGAVKLFTGRGR